MNVSAGISQFVQQRPPFSHCICRDEHVSDCGDSSGHIPHREFRRHLVNEPLRVLVASELPPQLDEAASAAAPGEFAWENGPKIDRTVTVFLDRKPRKDQLFSSWFFSILRAYARVRVSRKVIRFDGIF